MKTFEDAPHPRRYYKNDDAYIDAIYRKNKEIIDRKLSDVGTGRPKALFKTLVKEYIEEGKTPRQSASIVGRSELFVPRAERLGSNAFSALRKDPTSWKAFSSLRSKRDERGRFTKIDTTKLTWDKKQKVYVYNNEVVISFKNSPKITIVKKI